MLLLLLAVLGRRKHICKGMYAPAPVSIQICAVVIAFKKPCAHDRLANAGRPADEDQLLFHGLAFSFAVNLNNGSPFFSVPYCTMPPFSIARAEAIFSLAHPP